MPPLRRTGSMHGLGGQTVALKNDNLIEFASERARGCETSHTCADHNCLFPDQN
jgi:hypothetical protein